MTSPTQRLAKNIVSNWASMVVQMAAAFVISPILVHSLGKAVYGIWALVFSIVNYMAFLDFGMKQSLSRHFPMYYARKDYEKLNEVLNSSGMIYSVAGGLTIIGTLVVAFFFADFFKVGDDLMPTMRTLLIIVGLSQAVSFFFMAGTAIGPFHRYDISNFIDIVRIIANTAVVIYAVKAGCGLITLGLITLATNVANCIARRITQQVIVPQLRIGWRFVKKEMVRELLSYSWYSFLVVVGLVILFNADNIIIGVFLSTSAVTIYSIAATLLIYMRTFVASIGLPLAPAISHLDASKDTREIARLMERLLRYLYFLSTAICVGVLLFGGDFITLWMGQGFDETIVILHMLIVPAVIYLPLVMSNSVFFGTGKHKKLFYLTGSEAVSKIVLSVILLQYWGIYGVALGSMIPQVVIYSYFYPRAYYQLLDVPLKEFYIGTVRTIGLSLLFCLPIGLLMKHTVAVGSWGSFIFVVVVIGLFSAAGFWWKVLDRADKQRFLPQFLR
jgi:O-antigen/teichoic acid export membrane protein